MRAACFLPLSFYLTPFVFLSVSKAGTQLSGTPDRPAGKKRDKRPWGIHLKKKKTKKTNLVLKNLHITVLVNTLFKIKI